MLYDLNLECLVGGDIEQDKVCQWANEWIVGGDIKHNYSGGADVMGILIDKVWYSNKLKMNGL